MIYTLLRRACSLWKCWRLWWACWSSFIRRISLLLLLWALFLSFLTCLVDAFSSSVVLISFCIFARLWCWCILLCALPVLFECGIVCCWVYYVYRVWWYIDIAIMGSPVDTVKMLIPATIYAIQNNLLFIALSNLNATSYPCLLSLCFSSMSGRGRRIIISPLLPV